MENKMFCYQCQETAGCTGCTKVGVCGKSPELARLQDLLIYTTKGLSEVTTRLREEGKTIDTTVNHLITINLFSTITNANFDDAVFYARIKETLATKETLLAKLNNKENLSEAALWNATSEVEMDQKVSLLERIKNSFSKNKEAIDINKILDEKAPSVGVLATENEDIRSLRELITYGIKGMSAYMKHANALGYQNEEIDAFMQATLTKLMNDNLGADDLVALALETGKVGVDAMALLDSANTGTYGHPEMTKVNIGVRNNPGILISGHDLKDLEMLLQQTEGKGINIYTHGEMLPSHGYPGLKKYKHLVGNFGGAWQDQQKEFDSIPGCILMTTNCLMRPRETYKDRIFTTNVVGWDGVKFVPKKEDGTKDFSEIIEKALELGGYEEDQEPHEILVGFGHHATLSNAGAIVDAVKQGKIRHFFLIGGCDGARPGRNYYTEFAKKVPQDCVILTLACGKYRFNKLDFGEVAGLPRLLDVGQCNDAYSAVRIATALADAFETDVNGLPLSLIISWYEQKAVADLLALLSLGIKGIYLGPTLPAFLSPNVLQYLVDTFDLRPISTPDDDLKSCLQQEV